MTSCLAEFTDGQASKQTIDQPGRSPCNSKLRPAYIAK
jgi:hypothetical protein